MTPRQKAISLAPEMDNVIKRMMDERDEEKRNGDPDELYSMYAKDVKSIRKVRTLLKQGKYQEASDKGTSLDTIVRERIPDEVYNFLLDVAYERV